MNGRSPELNARTFSNGGEVFGSSNPPSGNKNILPLGYVCGKYRSTRGLDAGGGTNADLNAFRGRTDSHCTRPHRHELTICRRITSCYILVFRCKSFEMSVLPRDIAPTNHRLIHSPGFDRKTGFSYHTTPHHTTPHHTTPHSRSHIIRDAVRSVQPSHKPDCLVQTVVVIAPSSHSVHKSRPRISPPTNA